MATVGQERRWRRYEVIVVNLALDILGAAKRRSGNMAVQTIEVRLALQVLRPFVSADSLARFWAAADNSAGHPWKTCHDQLIAIVRELHACDCPLDPANRYAEWMN